MIDNINQLIVDARTNEMAMETLLNEFKPLVSSVARKYFLVGLDKEDLVQEGMIGLYKAIINYKADKSAKFSTFATLLIERQIINAVKNKDNVQKANQTTDCFVNNQGEIIENDKINFSINSDILPEQNFLQKETESDMIKLIENSLSALENNILRLYLLGEDYKNIANNLKITQKSVDNSLSRIKKKLKFLKEK